MSTPVQACPSCGAANELPPEALALGKFRCHQCGEVAEIVPSGDGPVHVEPVQTAPSSLPSAHNTAQVAADAEAREGWLTCSMVLLLAGLAILLAFSVFVC